MQINDVSQWVNLKLLLEKLRTATETLFTKYLQQGKTVYKLIWLPNFWASQAQPAIWNVVFFQFCTAYMAPGQTPIALHPRNHIISCTLKRIMWFTYHTKNIFVIVILITYVTWGLPLLSFVGFPVLLSWAFPSIWLTLGFSPSGLWSFLSPLPSVFMSLVQVVKPKLHFLTRKKNTSGSWITASDGTDLCSRYTAKITSDGGCGFPSSPPEFACCHNLSGFK